MNGLCRYRPLVCAVACLLFGAHALAVEPGHAAPAFELPPLDANGALALSDLSGHWVYLDFWASWCAPCRQAFPWMNRLQAEFADAGLRVVAINLDRERGNARRFLKRIAADFRVLWDRASSTPERYGVPGMPASYVIDPQGEVRAVYIGFHPDDAAQRHARIARLLAGDEGGAD